MQDQGLTANMALSFSTRPIPTYDDRFSGVVWSKTEDSCPNCESLIKIYMGDFLALRDKLNLNMHPHDSALCFLCILDREARAKSWEMPSTPFWKA